MKNIAFLDWSLEVVCPHCQYENDLACIDDETPGLKIFSNQWADLEGYMVTCANCNEHFSIDKVEY